MCRNSHFTLSDVRNCKYSDFDKYFESLNELIDEENESLETDEVVT